MAKAVALHTKLVVVLKTRKKENLLSDVEEVWKCLDSELLNEYFHNVTNRAKTEKEMEYEKMLSSASDKLVKDLTDYYDKEFNKLVK